MLLSTLLPTFSKCRIEYITRMEQMKSGALYTTNTMAIFVMLQNFAYLWQLYVSNKNKLFDVILKMSSNAIITTILREQKLKAFLDIKPFEAVTLSISSNKLKILFCVGLERVLITAYYIFSVESAMNRSSDIELQIKDPTHKKLYC